VCACAPPDPIVGLRGRIGRERARNGEGRKGEKREVETRKEEGNGEGKEDAIPSFHDFWLRRW